MRLVLSNDDGVEAEGIATLHSVLAGRSECLIVAPSGPQSGVGHAVTTTEPMPLQELGPRRFGLGGTPADCARVAFGRSGAFARNAFEGKPTGRARAGATQEESTAAASDLWMIAGINHGANLGVDTYISGTAAAAREAAILGFPAIAISQYVGRLRRPDWSATAERARLALDALLGRPPRPGHFWNVNLPHPADESVRHELVYCPLDPSPHAFQYETRDGHLHWVSDFHARPRVGGHDIDVCMGGQISITEIPVKPAHEAPTEAER